MRQAFKYRIYLTNGQRRILEQQLDACRWVYNETLALRKNAWEQEQRRVDWYETKRALPLLKA
ncbi:MAG TPA: helix-turn-helix domain-containing protein, partial [Herpetosiphonaceae bacterium]|nr:helix-turn-helix domain-containing protein [Herpetosiphonaceae bacterium]